MCGQVTDHVGRLAALGLGDLLDRTLDFFDIDGLALNCNGGLQYGFDLAQLVGIARDEVDYWRSCHGVDFSTKQIVPAPDMKEFVRAAW